MKLSITALLTVILGAAPLQGVAAADSGNGEILAKRWCAACHVVAEGQTQAATQAPPFSAIAKQPGMNAGRIALFLLVPHPRMPDMNLSRSEAADLAAYIARQAR